MSSRFKKAESPAWSRGKVTPTPATSRRRAAFHGSCALADHELVIERRDAIRGPHARPIEPIDERARRARRPFIDEPYRLREHAAQLLSRVTRTQLAEWNRAVQLRELLALRML